MKSTGINYARRDKLKLENKSFAGLVASLNPLDLFCVDSTGRIFWREEIEEQLVCILEGVAEYPEFAKELRKK